MPMPTHASGATGIFRQPLNLPGPTADELIGPIARPLITIIVMTCLVVAFLTWQFHPSGHATDQRRKLARTIQEKVLAMSTTTESSLFLDRRDPNAQRLTPGAERRQFTNSHDGLSPDAAELGRAIDQYKLMNRRRFITYDEMLAVIKSLGYEKPAPENANR